MIASDTVPAAHTWLAGLTPAERLVAVHLAQGLSNKEISTLLGKAEPTIKHQISAVLEKTGVSSRGRFIALYHQQLLPAPRAACAQGRRRPPQPLPGHHPQSVFAQGYDATSHLYGGMKKVGIRSRYELVNRFRPAPHLPLPEVECLEYAI